jgi:hypothetical protein
MKSAFLKELRFWRALAIVSNVALAVVLLSGAAQPADKPKFAEIDVERINIREADGTLRVVISNRARMPGLIKADGTTIPRTGLNPPGLLFYNAQGGECGGLRFEGESRDGGQVAGAHLLFDQHNQDQTIGLLYEDVNGARRAAFRVWDRPDGTEGSVAAARVFLGKDRDRSAQLVLSDPNGKPRLRLAVDATGAPSLQFLDAAGQVVQTLPSRAQP